MKMILLNTIQPYHLTVENQLHGGKRCGEKSLCMYRYYIFSEVSFREGFVGVPGGGSPGGGRENPGGGTEKSIPPTICTTANHQHKTIPGLF
jgi:hypothetical protein